MSGWVLFWWRKGEGEIGSPQFAALYTVTQHHTIEQASDWVGVEGEGVEGEAVGRLVVAQFTVLAVPSSYTTDR